MRFAAGGASPASYTPTDTAAGGAQYLMNPNYVGPGGPSGWIGSTPYSALAPNQQAWADTTRNLENQALTAGRADYGYWSGGGSNPEGPSPTAGIWSQITPMPNAIWPTAAPAAPAPIAEAPPATVMQPTRPNPSPDPQNQPRRWRFRGCRM